MSKTKAPRKHATLIFRCPEHDADAIKRDAARQGRSISEWLRQTCRNALGNTPQDGNSAPWSIGNKEST